METNELILTAIVLERAIQLRKESAEDLNSEPPPLDPFLAPAIESLRQWHPRVMEALRKSPT